MSSLGSFARALQAAPTMDQAADLLLERTLALATACLQENETTVDARITRTVLHLRPDGDYEELIIREAQIDEECQSAAVYVPSATIWRMLDEYQQAIAVDVLTKSFTAVSTANDGVFVDEDSAALGETEWSTSAVILERGTTHLLILPISTACEELLGHVSIELSCRQASGLVLPWETHVSDFELSVSIATPHLLEKPSSELPGVEDDAMPAVGQKTARVMRLLRSFSYLNETILLTGETGVGKSRLARWCHDNSPRSDEAFEVLDLSVVPADMQAGELFGWRKGAFTGASADHSGAVVRAEGGTLLIDEVDTLSPNAQLALLRLLEEGRYRPLGEEGPIRTADVRFIVATNTNLGAAVENGTFREDLFYRINVLPVQVPALRERLDELPGWVQTMAAQYAVELNIPGPEFLPDAMTALTNSRWPGNLRQLNNVVRRAIAIAQADPDAASADGTVRRISESHVVDALQLGLSGLDKEDEHDLFGLMTRAASAFVDEAERRHAESEEIDLALADAFSALVLTQAAERFGSPAKAYSALGCSHVVRSRNHSKLFRKALTSVRDLEEELKGKSSSEVPDLKIAN